MIPVELIGGPEDGQCIDVPEAAIGKVLWARPEDGALYHFYMASECPCCFETAEGRRRLFYIGSARELPHNATSAVLPD